MIKNSRFFETYYGGKRPFIILMLSFVKYFFRRYTPYKNINFSAVKRIVFVCKGNISRSPYGQYKALSFGLASASFGLEAAAGSPADPMALICAEDMNISLQSHESTHISSFIFMSGDLILCFEPSQAEKLQKYDIPVKVQISLVGLWAAPMRPFIADPYGLNKSYYKTCYSLINHAVEKLKSKII